MSRHEQMLWQTMMARSFEPRQWFDGYEDLVTDDDRGGGTSPLTREERIMWVYRRTEQGLYTVGYYDPQGEWHSESDHPTRERAAERVHWLNGGANDKEKMARGR